jgi:sulfide:quinone oxidoreductase
MSRIVILGAGFGGIAVATELRRLLGGYHEVVLVDRHMQFFMGLRKLWELVGIGTIADGSRSRRLLAGHGIDFVPASVEAIDPAARTLRCDGSSWDADVLVVALGAEPRPDLVPGMAEHAHDVWEAGSVPTARAALEAFEGGRIAVVIAGAPYPCPPAPYECAMLVDEWLRDRDLRERTELVVSTFQPILLPNAGREGSAWLGEQLAARGIEARVGHKVERVDERTVVYADGGLEADLVIGVPPHRVPAVVADSALTADGDWVSVDPGTLATRHPGVFAVGDVSQITLANGLPLPKAGIIAEREGTRVAAAIAAEVQGGELPPPFDGHGHCFIEMGRSTAALVEGQFFAEPEPLVQLREPSAENAEEKRRFEAERLARWFGR